LRYDLRVQALFNQLAVDNEIETQFEEFKFIHWH